MGMGLSSIGEEAGIVLTGFLEEEDALEGAEDEGVGLGTAWLDDEAEEESDLVAVEEKHLARIDDEAAAGCADVDADVDVSERFRKRPATVLRQVLDDAMSNDEAAVGAMQCFVCCDP